MGAPWKPEVSIWAGGWLRQETYKKRASKQRCGRKRSGWMYSSLKLEQTNGDGGSRHPSRIRTKNLENEPLPAEAETSLRSLSMSSKAFSFPSIYSTQEKNKDRRSSHKSPMKLEWQADRRRVWKLEKIEETCNLAPKLVFSAVNWGECWTWLGLSSYAPLAASRFSSKLPWKFSS